MRKNISIICFGLFILASCVIPEKYSCEIEVKDLKNYSVSFKGTVFFWMAVEEISAKGSLSRETDNEIKKIFDEWTVTDPKIMAYQYLNNGRAYIEYQETINDGSALDFSENLGLPLRINVIGNNSIMIKIDSSGDDDFFPELNRYGYKMDGNLVVISQIPIIESSGIQIQRQNNKYIVQKTLSSFPENEIIITMRQ